MLRPLSLLHRYQTVRLWYMHGFHLAEMSIMHNGFAPALYVSLPDMPEAASGQVEHIGILVCI
jgi:hypothetical protein